MDDSDVGDLKFVDVGDEICLNGHQRKVHKILLKNWTEN